MDEDRVDEQTATLPTPNKQWPLTVVLLLLCTPVLSLLYVWHQVRYAHQLEAKNAAISASLSQTRSQLEALTAKLNAVTPLPAAEPVAPPTQPSGAAAAHRVTRRATARPRAAEDPRWKQFEEKLAEHQKQITSTQQNLDKTRGELEANLKSTRDDLGSSIARNHEEVMALQKKGERNYYEFDLAKSKQFKRAGPLSISLRKTNAKKAYYDMVVLMDDFELTKKHVNLYEPVIFYPGDSTQPLELVVNRVGKDQVHGYVSESKYKPSELAATGPAGAEPSSPSKSDAEAILTHRPEPPQ